MADYALRLESIRDDARDKLRHWRKGHVRMGADEVAGAKGLCGRKPFVKEVLRIETNGTLAKRELKGHKSYLDAKGAGARGIYYHYVLREGRCYQIQCQISRTKAERFFAIVTNRDLVKIDEKTATCYAASRTQNHA